MDCRVKTPGTLAERPALSALRYWSRLQSLSSEPQSIISLCKLFEVLVQSRNPHVVYHTLSIGLQPLTIVFPWIFTAFAGTLAVDQTLVLWDRIIAFDRLELLSVLAAAIFIWRSKAILACDNGDDLVHLFSDNSKILVIPFLQHFLFG